jgi:Fe-S cluster biogenesis protein NfuA
MFIQTENTPNPATLKFLPGQTVMGSGTADFKSVSEAKKSPLALALFDIEGGESVFLGADFISITKLDETGWDLLKPLILGAIMGHFQLGSPVIEDGEDLEDKNAQEDSDPLVRKIKELIDTRVRPAVAQDGGDIVYHGFEKGIVYLQMQGACSGCPSSTITLKNGIENMLKHYVPEVSEVRAVD